MDEQTLDTDEQTNDEMPADAQPSPESGDEPGDEPGDGLSPESGDELEADVLADASADTPEDASPDAAEDPHAEAPAETPDPPAEPPAHDADEELRAATEERDQWRDRHLRLAADFDNYRKRSEDRMRSRWDSAQADLAGRLLEPLDDLERLTGWEGEAPATAEAVVEGAELVGRKFRRILEDAGVSVVDPAGERFDPNTMEAMMRAPAESDDDDEKVERVFQKGYAFKGQLLRPARVSVYKAE